MSQTNPSRPSRQYHYWLTGLLLLAWLIAFPGQPRAAVVEAYADTVQRVYIAYYGRPADPAGLDYWTNQLNEAGGDLANIIEQFANSTESNSLYGSQSDSQKITSIYQQLFGRDPDSAGLDYYTDQLANGQSTHANIMLDVLNGSVNDDAEIIAAKLEIASRFTADLDTSAEIAAYNETSVPEIRSWMSQINQDTDTDGVDTQISSIVDIDANPGTDTNNALTGSETAARFLTQATFGPTPTDIDNLSNGDQSAWLVDQFNKPNTTSRSILESYLRKYAPEVNNEDPDLDGFETREEVLTTFNYAFWINAIKGDDQLRQRMIYALSQLMVVSAYGGEELYDSPNSVIYYQDILAQHAFGNYRDLLEDVTYSPAMGIYLTYMGNRKGDPATGRVPDENYAREILQLFTIGLVELNMDGTPVTDGSGNPIETYDNKDITGLARVFTGLYMDEDEEENTDVETINGNVLATAWAMPMSLFEEDHSELEKSFLGYTIPANTPGRQSISMALDHIFSHKNVAPFVSRQLIQRFVTSHPSPGYVQRVATAFEDGRYQLPNGASIGSTGRGDLKATLTAILMDDEARNDNVASTFGKVREPVIRLANWARAFKVNNVTPEYWQVFYETFTSETLNQMAYTSPSVFNFYRPGYVAPGTLTGSAGLTLPELQITNASSITGYTNFIDNFIRNDRRYIDNDELEEILEEDYTTAQIDDFRDSFAPDYSSELALADNPTALLERLDSLLTYGNLTTTKQHIINTINQIDLNSEEDGRDGATQRVQLAILMVMTSPEYLVQK